MKTQAVSHLLNKNACNKTKLTSTHDFKRAACFPARSGDRRKDTGTHLHMGRKCHVCGHVLSSQFKSAMTAQVRLSVSLC